MKMYTPEKSELIRVSAVEPHRIMGAMPMKAVLRPEELHASFVFLKPRVVWTLLAMLFRPAVRG